MRRAHPPRPQTPHEKLSLLDADSDAYWLTPVGAPLTRLDVLAHGPEWVCLAEDCRDQGPGRDALVIDGDPFWIRWNALAPFHIVEG